ncbi:glycoside hydrolase family 16 [Trichoderma arundinaceum]|uniref:Glycoside hydrolase family 16 n=1 Tax=Trichoderma arundinaceum TaxID=490622 RepID=A0A395NGI0_TRIAR|nr:glycoside hydrolase family 16 [Trichoderma arundinaceum]
MPWKDHLNRFKQEFNHIVAESGTASKPPPVPPHPPSEPPFRGEVYWKPQFHPNVAVSHEWEAKIGNGPDGWGNQEVQFYTAEPQNAFHTPEGMLVIRALANNSAPLPEHRYTSARLVSKQALGRDRGVLTATILSPCAEGIWPAFWLLPREPFSWPTDGEIDIAETWNGDHENRTRIPDMHCRPVRYDFAWEQPNGVPGQGRMIWDMTILLNVAIGGNVCGGKTPRNGYYDMVVYSLSMVKSVNIVAPASDEFHHT